MLADYGTVVVTGGLGFIGRHLVRALLALGKQVTVADNCATAGEGALVPGATLVATDIRVPAQVEAALAGADLVFHVAGNSSSTLSVVAPRLDFETNAVGTFNVVEASVAAGVRLLLYVSSAAVYGAPRHCPVDEDHPVRPFLPYGASKLAGELVALARTGTDELPVVIARPFCVYGPGEHPDVALVEVARYLRWHLNGRSIEVVGDPDAKTRDFLHVSDLVSALLLLADRAPAGEVYNVGSGEETSMRELAGTIGAVTSRAAALAHVPTTDDTYSLVADISKLRMLGFVPRTALADGVRSLANELGRRPPLPGTATVFRAGEPAERSLEGA